MDSELRAACLAIHDHIKTSDIGFLTEVLDLNNALLLAAPEDDRSAKIGALFIVAELQREVRSTRADLDRTHQQMQDLQAQLRILMDENAALKRKAKEGEPATPLFERRGRSAEPEGARTFDTVGTATTGARRSAEETGKRMTKKLRTIRGNQIANFLSSNT